MKIKQILLCMLLACFILPASAQNSWGIVGGGLFSKSLSRDARFSLGGYAGGMYDVHVKNSWYVQPQLLFTYEEFRSKTRLGTDSFFSKFNLELPILASYNVALNNKWNLRINAGPYLSYAMFGRDKSIDYAYGNGMHSSLGCSIRIFQIILLTVEGPGFHWNPSISFTLSMVNVLFVRGLSGGMSVYRPV